MIKEFEGSMRNINNLLRQYYSGTVTNDVNSAVNLVEGILLNSKTVLGKDISKLNDNEHENSWRFINEKISTIPGLEFKKDIKVSLGESDLLILCAVAIPLPTAMTESTISVVEQNIKTYLDSCFEADFQVEVLARYVDDNGLCNLPFEVLEMLGLA